VRGSVIFFSTGGLFCSNHTAKGIIFTGTLGTRSGDHCLLAGLGDLRQINATTGEVKRMCVQPDFQGNGVGRVLFVD
jgi:GNAT superfamily N-acetyltransferase